MTMKMTARGGEGDDTGGFAWWFGGGAASWFLME